MSKLDRNLGSWSNSFMCGLFLFIVGQNLRCNSNMQYRPRMGCSGKTLGIPLSVVGNHCGWEGK